VIELLRIENLAVVARAELAFGSGLNVVTGETGAGKSIVLGALSLLAGGRASVDAVRDGADEAVVEALFRTDALPELEAELEKRGFTTADHELVVRRSVARSGRSRAQLSGQLVPVSLLAELFEGRLEISSQHESQALLRPETHGVLLDGFGGCLALRGEVGEGFTRLRALDEELSRLRAEAAERARRQDFLSFQLREIDEAKLVPREREALTSERARLAHAERLQAEAAAAVGLLSGEGGREDGLGAASLVAESARRLESGARLDPGLEDLAKRLRAVQAELGDVTRDVEAYGHGLEADPRRLSVLEERLADLERLCRKYGPSEEAVLAFREQAALDLEALAGAESRIESLGLERARAATSLAESATALSKARGRAATRLARALEAALQPLVEGAGIEVALEPVAALEGAPCGASGAESVELRFSGSPGEAARPLRKVASGGELSRVFLALKNVLRRSAPGMVLVFDEVDAGIGGRVADRVGRALAELAAEHQVLCITHLPQIAARGATHFRVEKAERSGRTSASVVRLEAAARVEEIARMAGGETVSEATRRHARELLKERGGAARS
jgi:DNA repair protein RecN (Recombination protein N)